MKLSGHCEKAVLVRALAIAALLPALVPWAAEDSGRQTPQIRFDQTLHDFGELRSDEKVEFDWVFHNDGAGPLQIVDTRTSCGCTMTLTDGEVVPPGKSGTINVTFDGAGQHGTVRKNLAVISNDPVNSRVLLTVTARVQSVEVPVVPGGHPPISGQSLLMGSCAECHAAPATGRTGEPLYQAVCGMCHGAQATGALAPSLRHPSYLNSRSDEELTVGIAYGTANPRMPGFAELMGGPLSDDQIRSLVELLRQWGATAKTTSGRPAAGTRSGGS